MDQDVTLRQGNDYEIYFNPATYLKFYETPDTIGDWGIKMAAHYKEAFSGLSGDRLLDVGCGPSIHAVIPASRYVNQIHLADYAACNRQAIEDWISKRSEAHDWGPFFKYWATVEDQGQAWQDVEQRVRDAIKFVMTCDVTKENPLDPELMSFDCIVANLCLEAASPSEDAYRQAMKNVVGMLKPGGRLLISGALNQTKYPVGEEVFYCLVVNETLLRSAVEASDCHIDELHVHSINAEMKDKSDLSAYFFLKATKNTT